LQRVKSIVQSTKGHNIVVLEAAVLLSANWQYHCHEIWVSIIPREEVKHDSLNNSYTFLQLVGYDLTVRT